MPQPPRSIPSHFVYYPKLLLLSTLKLPLMKSLLISSYLVTPLVHLYTLISLTLNFCSVFLYLAQHSELYIIAGLCLLTLSPLQPSILNHVHHIFLYIFSIEHILNTWNFTPRSLYHQLYSLSLFHTILLLDQNRTPSSSSLPFYFVIFLIIKLSRFIGFIFLKMLSVLLSIWVDFVIFSKNFCLRYIYVQGRLNILNNNIALITRVLAAVSPTMSTSTISLYYFIFLKTK